MKSILLLPLFWGIIISVYAAEPVINAPAAPFSQPLDYDTSTMGTLTDHLDGNQLPTILPQPGAKLNYTQVMFEHAQVNGAEAYLLEVIVDEPGNSFDHPLIKRQDSSTAILLSNFKFGTKYVWRFTGLNNGKELGWNGPYNFEILNNPFVDKRLYRVKVLQSDSLSNTAGLIILDIASGIINRKGEFVWFLPAENSPADLDMMLFHQSNQVRDLRVTPFGTITLLNGRDAEERDLNGKVVWTAPQHLFGADTLNPDRHYFYHHCFKRLPSGNYMVLDIARASKPLGSKDITTVASMSYDALKDMVDYEIIKEFDRAGNLLWNWSSANYFNVNELRDLVQNNSGKGLVNSAPGGHMNAFDVDETNGWVYAGFRNASRVIKIDKKSGQVVCSWGDNGSYRGAKNGNGFFSKQHGITLLHDGSLTVFNNNPEQEPNSNTGKVSGVVTFTQPTDSALSKINLKFDCRFTSKNNAVSTGGNVDELKNHNLLVCMGSVNRIFEINPAQHIVWNAVIERHEQNDTTWKPCPLHSAHYISSLYPCYFTLQTGHKVLKDGSSTFQLKIFNDGTEDDSYMVVISSSTGSYNNQFSSDVLSGGKEISFDIVPKQLASSNESIDVTVISKANPAYHRNVSIR